MANDFLSALFNAISNSSGSGGNNWSDNAKKNSSVQKKNSNSSSSKNNGSSQKSQASVKSAIDTSDKSSNSASKTTTSTNTPKASSTKTTDSFSPNSANTVDTSDLYQSTPFDITSAAQGFMDDNFGVRQANADVTDKTPEGGVSDEQVHENEAKNDIWNNPDVDKQIQQHVDATNENRDPDNQIDASVVKKIAKSHWEKDTSIDYYEAMFDAIDDYDDILAKASEDSSESTEKSSDGKSTLKFVDRTKEWLDNSEEGQAYLKALPSSIRKEYKQNGAWAVIRTMEDAAYGHALNSKQYTDLMNYVDSSGGTAVQDNIDTYKDYDGKGTSIDLNGDGKLTEDEVDAWNTWSRKNNTDSDATTWYNNKANVDEQHTQAFQNLESSYIANLYANYLEGQEGPTMTSNEDGSVTLSDTVNEYNLSAAQAEALDGLITKDNYKDFQATSNDALMDADGYWTDGFQNFNNLMSADRMLNANYKKDSNGSYSVNTDRYGNLSDEAVANMINTLDGTTYGVASSADAGNYGTATDSDSPFDQTINFFSNLNLSSQGVDNSRKLIKGVYNPDTVSDSIGKLFNSEDLSFDDVYNLMGEDGVTYQDGTGVLYTTT